MQFHTLTRVNKNKKSVKVGRGGKRGKTAGRGTKGQKARAGRKLRPELRDIIKKYPKLRGRGVNSNLSIQTKPLVVNLREIESSFKGTEVTPKTLVESGIISIHKGMTPKVKILSMGELTKKLVFSNCEVSAGAKTKIEKVGGEVKAKA